MASASVDAWLAEGERLLELCSSASDDQRAAVSAALQDAAAVMRCTQSARRSTALDSLPADIVDTALMFLDVEGLNMLGTANRGFGARIAGATVAWNALTRRTFPVEALVNKNVLKLKGRESFHRMARLWRGNSYDDAMRLASPYPPPPISAYSMLVRISSVDGARLAEGLCDIGYSTENSLFVDADELWRSCLPLSVAQSFNELFVTTDIPEPRDLETWLEVGSWTWGWMEPPLGQISFFILCVQFAKDRMHNIGVKPYIDFLLSSRASRLSNSFQKYNKKVVQDFAIAAWYEK